VKKGLFFDYLTASEGAGPPVHTGGSVSLNAETNVLPDQETNKGRGSAKALDPRYALLA
jgi:hypothetical protein